METQARPGLGVCAVILSLLLGFSVGSLQAAAKEVDAADARILIDISGSMKKNDPKNLRRPALRLLVGLLPDDARAGVWAFGQWVNMMIPLGQVDDAWKARARKAADKIASPGQFTNIEDVIRRSTADWGGSSTKFRRHLILLTDGMVDISKDSAKNDASRKRILEELLPKLKEFDARVHTIALSERADHELMRTLSEETDGWYEQVESAEQLQRVFLRIFEKVGQPDTLPLTDNKFQVDNSIQEVTLLVFRAEDAIPTTITSPSGKVISAKDHGDGVVWHRDIGFDMVTIDKPEQGEWSVQAAVDPDNRVIVVTDLKMKTGSLPSRFVLGEQIPLEVQFTNQGKQISRKDFLDVVRVYSQELDSQGAGEQRPIFDDGNDGDAKGGDGIFTQLVGDREEGGQVELVVRGVGQTFERESRQRFELAVAVKADVVSEADGSIKVRYTADPEIVNIDSLSYSAVLIDPEGQEQPAMLLPGETGEIKEAAFNPAELLQGTWKLQTKVKAETVAGNELSLTMPVVEMDGMAVPAPEPKPEPEPEPQPEPEPAPQPEPEPAPEPKLELEPKPEKQETSLMTQMVYIGIGNLLLVILGGLVYWLIRRRGKDDSVVLVEDEAASDEEAAG